jgi:hypothetical protein
MAEKKGLNTPLGVGFSSWVDSFLMAEKELL